MKDDGINFTQSFLDKFADKIGPRAADVIVEDRDTIREMKQRQKQAEKQLQQAQKLASQREQENEELKVLRRKIKQIDVRLMPFRMNMVRILKVKQSCVGSKN